MRTLYSLGLSDAEIAQQTGSKRADVREWRKTNGLPNNCFACSYKRALPPEKWESMREFLGAVNHYRPRDVGGFMKVWREVGGAAKY